MNPWTWTRIHGTRFYLVSFDGEHHAAVCDDFGQLVLVSVA